MKSSPGDDLEIGPAAARFGLPTHVLRHWEAEGLLAPERSHGRRLFSEADLFRIAFVLRAKEAGLSLTEIRSIVTAADGAARKEALRRRETELVRTIEQTQAALELIRHGINCPHEDFFACPNFRSDIADRLSNRG